MERRDFGEIALAGALSGTLVPEASAQPAGRESRRASYAGVGRPPMKWNIKHALQRPEMQLAKQLGMDWVKLTAATATISGR